MKIVRFIALTLCAAVAGFAQADLVTSVENNGAYLYTNSGTYTPDAAGTRLGYRENIAYGRTATQTGGDSNWGVPGNAVDGNTSSGNFSHTKSNSAGNWLAIALTDTATPITTITIWNRYDNAGNNGRLVSFHFSLSTGGTMSWTSDTYTNNMPITDPVKSWNYTPNTANPMTGDAFTFTHESANYLHLTEVRLFGKETTPQAGKSGDFVEGGKQYIASNFTQSADATLQISADFSVATPVINVLDVSGEFKQAGIVNLNITNSDNLAPGEYTLVSANSYSGSISGLSVSGDSGSYIFSYKNGKVTASTGAIWTGAADSNLANTANWSSDPTNQNAYLGVNSAANATLSAATPSSITLASLSLGLYANSQGSLAVSGGDLTVTDAINLGVTASGSINQSGGTISADGMVLNGSSAATSGTYTMTGGTLNIGSGGITATGGNNYTLTLGGGTVNFANSLTETIAAVFTGAGDNRATLSAASGQTLIWTGAMTGTGFIKSGDGAMTVSNMNFTEGVTVNGGNLNVSQTGISSTTVINNGGTLTLTNKIEAAKRFTGDVYINQGGKLVCADDADTLGYGTASTNNIYVYGGELQNTASNETIYKTNIYLKGGTLSSTTANGFHLLDNTAKIIAQAEDTATAENPTVSYVTSNLALRKGTRTITTQANSQLNISGIIYADSSAASGKNTGGLTLEGEGCVVFTGHSNYQNNTTINGGVLDLTNGALYSTAYFGSALAQMYLNNGATLIVNNFGYAENASGKSTSSLGGLSYVEKDAPFFHMNNGTVKITQTFNSNEAIGRFIDLQAGGGTLEIASGVEVNITGAISGSGKLTKTGAGTLKLSAGNAGNTYEGGTKVQTGELQLVGTNGGYSSVGTGALTIESGATVTALSHNVFGNGTGAIPEVIINGGTLTPYQYLHMTNVTLNGGTINNQNGTTDSMGLDFSNRNGTITSTGESAIKSIMNNDSTLTIDVHTSGRRPPII